MYFAVFSEYFSIISLRTVVCAFYCWDLAELTWEIPLDTAGFNARDFLRRIQQIIFMIQLLQSLFLFYSLCIKNLFYLFLELNKYFAPKIPHFKFFLGWSDLHFSFSTFSREFATSQVENSSRFLHFK